MNLTANSSILWGIRECKTAAMLPALDPATAFVLGNDFVPLSREEDRFDSSINTEDAPNWYGNKWPHPLKLRVRNFIQFGWLAHSIIFLQPEKRYHTSMDCFCIQASTMTQRKKWKMRNLPYRAVPVSSPSLFYEMQKNENEWIQSSRTSPVEIGEDGTQTWDRWVKLTKLKCLSDFEDRRKVEIEWASTSILSPAAPARFSCFVTPNRTRMYRYGRIVCINISHVLYLLQNTVPVLVIFNPRAATG